MNNNTITNDSNNNTTVSSYDISNTDLENAYSDLKYAIQEKNVYLKRVSSGETFEEPQTLEALDDAINSAQEKCEAVESGEPYTELGIGDKLRTTDGQSVAGAIGSGLSSVVEKLTGYEDPTGTVSTNALEFAKVALPLAADKSEQMMNNVYDQYESETLKLFHQTYVMKDSNGNPITAEQG